MLVKTRELTGAALDWAVAKCEGFRIVKDHQYTEKTFFSGWWQCGPFAWQPLCKYSTEWAKGGPIIEREIFKLFRNVGGEFTAQIKNRVPYYSPTYDADIGRDEIISCSGYTPLIAAMRCYVVSKLGDEVEIPEELV